MVYQLIYGSSTSNNFSEAELAALLQKARENNHRLGISGILLHYDRNFLQVLEGDQGAVEALYAKISRDRRHGGMMIFSRGTLAEREFGDWSMAFRAPTRGEVVEQMGFREIREIAPGELGNAKVRALFASFRKMTRLEMAI